MATENWPETLQQAIRYFTDPDVITVDPAAWTEWTSTYTWGEFGGQQERLQVYGRAGEPCFTCGRPLSLVRIAGRSSVFCRRCQR